MAAEVHIKEVADEESQAATIPVIPPMLSRMDAPDGAAPLTNTKVVLYLSNFWYRLPTVSHDSANMCWQTKMRLAVQPE